MRRTWLIVLMMLAAIGPLGWLAQSSLASYWAVVFYRHHAFMLMLSAEAALMLLVLRSLQGPRLWASAWIARGWRVWRAVRHRVVHYIALAVVLWMTTESLYYGWPYFRIVLNLVLLACLIYQQISTWRAESMVRRVLRGFCARCGYNLKGNASGVCPECGSAISNVGRVAISESIVSPEEVEALAPVAG